jgi:hypothetical protein
MNFDSQFKLHRSKDSSHTVLALQVTPKIVKTTPRIGHNPCQVGEGLSVYFGRASKQKSAYALVNDWLIKNETGYQVVPKLVFRERYNLQPEPETAAPEPEPEEVFVPPPPPVITAAEVLEPTSDTPSLSLLSRNDLLELAKEVGLKGASSKSKDQLVELLGAYDKEVEDEQGLEYDGSRESSN